VTPRLRFTFIIALLLLLCTLWLLWVMRAPKTAVPAAQEVNQMTPAAAAVPVVLGIATEAADDVDIDVLGSGLAARAVTLFPAVAGEVAELDFRAGQRVVAQQVLLRLVDRDQRLAVDLAAARLDAAQSLLARYEVTRGTGAVPGSVIDEAQSGVALARIEVRQANEALADRVVRAPFAGVVGLAGVEPGDRVALGSLITTLDDRRSLQVAFELPEAYAARLKLGQALNVANPAFAGRRFEGQITEIDSRVDSISRNLRVRATVPNPEDMLRPGMSFQVQLILPGKRYVAVPELALQWGREGAFVWAVRDGKAVQVTVRSVRRTRSLVLVDGRLEVGEQVVVEGVQRLRAGRSVLVAEAGPTSIFSSTPP
jgi:RND family efflux transporter MFP subunit